MSIYLNVVFKRLVKMSKCVPFAFSSACSDYCSYLRPGKLKTAVKPA